MNCLILFLVKLQRPQRNLVLFFLTVSVDCACSLSHLLNICQLLIAFNIFFVEMIFSSSYAIALASLVNLDDWCWIIFFVMLVYLCICNVAGNNYLTTTLILNRCYSNSNFVMFVYLCICNDIKLFGLLLGKTVWSCWYKNRSLQWIS